MGFSDTVKTLTREVIIKKVYDTVLEGNVGLLRVLGNAKPWKSGYRYDIPVKYQKSTAGGIVPVGGTLDTSRTSTRIKMQFEPQRIHKPVVIDDIEVAVNQGDERVLELLATEMDSIAQDLTDDLGTYFYTGSGATGSSFDSILNAADDENLSSIKFLNSVKIRQSAENTELSQYGKCNDYGINNTTIKRSNYWNGFRRWLNQKIQDIFCVIGAELNFA